MAISQTKYIFVTSGVTSSLGKGVIAVSLAKLFQSYGLKVTILQLDPYLNIDQSTINTYEKGEPFVTTDGLEANLYLGEFERIVGEQTTTENYITLGKIFQNIINRERRGEYVGKTIQIIPHVTDEIKRCILTLSEKNKYDIVICEIGGMVGDIESNAYIEAIRQMKWELKNQTFVIHLTLVPNINLFGEYKTRPTQNSVRTLFETGVQPDIIILRTENQFENDICRKVAQYCNMDTHCVAQLPYISNTYTIPSQIHDMQIDKIVFEKLNITPKHDYDLYEWNKQYSNILESSTKIKIGIIGNYTDLADSYKSLIESIKITSINQNCIADIQLINADNIAPNNQKEKLDNLDALIIASDKGNRGLLGKQTSIQYALQNNKPILCIGLSMAIAIKEIDNTIEINTEQNIDYRKGIKQTKIIDNTKTYSIYGNSIIEERHRQIPEILINSLDNATNKNLIVSGTDETNKYIDIIELTTHPWFIGCTFNPEYNCTTMNQNQLFISLINKVKENNNNK